MNHPALGPGTCPFCVPGAGVPDYKDAARLAEFIRADGGVRSRRETGVCAEHQRQLAGAIRLAREVALLPYAQAS